MRALIVDDSKFVREYLQQMLEMMNVRCEQAVNGQDALGMLDGEAPFDLMFCDLYMPVMNGLDCLKAVRRSGLHDALRVMMVTTEKDHESIERAMECGADEFLMKPFTVEGLREKLILMGVHGL